MIVVINFLILKVVCFNGNKLMYELIIEREC